MILGITNNDFQLLYVHLQFLSHHAASSTRQSHLHQVIDGILVTCNQSGTKEVLLHSVCICV